ANQISLQHENTNYQWKDFVVLVRSNALKEDMRKAFDDCNIPYFIDVKNGFFESQGVSIILSCLRCLVDPDDDIAFCATLMSPLFNFDANDLALAKLNKDQHQSYYAYFKDNPKLLPLITLVQTASTLSLCEVMNEIFNLNDYYQENTSGQDKTNLDLLYQMAAHNQKDKA
ncbi:MAG: 3'-5' exonuclease, partial [Erysipelotrichaceae bacterium]